LSGRNKELLVGLIFMGLGIFGFVMSLEYPISDDGRVGPGAFPAALGVILTIIGVVQFGVTLRRKDIEEDLHIIWRPIVMIALSVMAFGLLTERFGAVLSLLVTTVIASFAAGRPKIVHISIVYLFIIAFVYFFLVRFVGFQIPLFV
jgi:hypothetical protein